MRDFDFRGLKTRLLRGGVAPKHVRRTLRELRHHYEDLEHRGLAEGLSAEDAAAQAAERLGDQHLIIEEALARPELRSWAFRLPWGIYGVLPVVALALAVVGSFLVCLWLLEIAQSASGLSEPAFAQAVVDHWWSRALLEGWMLGTVYALPAAVAGALCLFAARRDASILWPAIGVFLVLFLGFCCDIYFTPPPAADQLAEISASIGLGLDRLASPRVFRLLIPFAFLLGPYYWWSRKRPRESGA
jgi:hypothetical protein